jgi:integrase
LGCELTSNVCTSVEQFKERGRRRVIPTADLPAWWAKVQRIESPIKRNYWVGLLLTGLRRQELTSLRWEHVLRDPIKIVQPKGGERRAFEISPTPELKAVLDEVRAAGMTLFPRSPFVFAARSKLGYITDPFDPNLPGCSPHECRRSFCSLAIEIGIDPYTLKSLINHSTNGGSDTTQRYVLPSFEHRAMAARKIATNIFSRVQLSATTDA